MPKGMKKGAAMGKTYKSKSKPMMKKKGMSKKK